MTKVIKDILQRPTYPFWERDVTQSGSNAPVVNTLLQAKRLNAADVTNHYESDTDWKQRVALKQDATNHYRTSGWKNIVVPFSWQKSRLVSSGTNSEHYVSWLGDLGSFADETDGTISDIAVKRAKRKLSDVVPQKQLLAPVAELRELRGMIAQFAQFSYKWVTVLADIKRTKGKSAYKFASNAWLSYSFGAKPFLSDIDEITKSVIAFMERRDLVDLVTGSAKKTWKTRAVSELGNKPIGYAARADIDMVHTLSYRYTYAYAINWRSANDYTALDHLGLTVPALIPTLWELTAWSWLLDYFGTVGQWLDDTLISDPTRCIYCVVNRRYTVKFNVHLYHYNTAPWNTNVVGLGGEPGVGGADYYYFRRDALPTLPNRILRFKTLKEIPGADGGVNKLLNLVSLLLARR
jgi:hypothetical protein